MESASNWSRSLSLAQALYPSLTPPFALVAFRGWSEPPGCRVPLKSTCTAQQSIMSTLRVENLSFWEKQSRPSGAFLDLCLSALYSTGTEWQLRSRHGLAGCLSNKQVILPRHWFLFLYIPFTGDIFPVPQIKGRKLRGLSLSGVHVLWSNSKVVLFGYVFSAFPW